MSSIADFQEEVVPVSVEIPPKEKDKESDMFCKEHPNGSSMSLDDKDESELLPFDLLVKRLKQQLKKEEPKEGDEKPRYLITYNFVPRNNRINRPFSHLHTETKPPRMTSRRVYHTVIMRDPVDWILRTRKECDDGTYTLLNAIEIPDWMQEEDLEILRD